MHTLSQQVCFQSTNCLLPSPLTGRLSQLDGTVFQIQLVPDEVSPVSKFDAMRTWRRENSRVRSPSLARFHCTEQPALTRLKATHLLSRGALGPLGTVLRSFQQRLPSRVTRYVCDKSKGGSIVAYTAVLNRTLTYPQLPEDLVCDIPVRVTNEESLRSTCWQVARRWRDRQPVVPTHYRCWTLRHHCTLRNNTLLLKADARV